MKRLLHELKYDFRRWRTLILTLWGLAVLLVVLMAVFARVVADTDWASILGQPAHFITMLLGGGVAVLCLLAGGSDSPVRATTWLMTRPRQGIALGISRALIVIGGGILPLCFAWWGTLFGTGFDGGTMATAFPHFGLTVLACVAGLTLWALVDPSLPGVFVGVALASFASALLRMFPGLRPPDWLYRGGYTFLALAAAGAVASLWGLRGLRRRLTLRKKALTGLAIGFTGVGALWGAIPLEIWFRKRDELDVSFAFKDAREWHLDAGSAVPAEVAIDSNGIRASFFLPMPGAAEELAGLPRGAEVRAFSWRRLPEDPWSDWIAPEKVQYHFQEDLWTLSFSYPAGFAVELNKGELRLALEKPPGLHVEPVVPPADGSATWRGPGWTLTMLPLQMEGNAQLTYVSRSLGSEPAAVRFIDEDLRGAGTSPAGTSDTTLRLPFFQSTYSSQRSKPFPSQGSAPSVLPSRVNLIRPLSPSERRCLVHITGVTLNRPASLGKKERPTPSSPPPPAQPQAPLTQPPVDAFSRTKSFNTPGPWNQEEPLTPPAAEAPEPDVARWLQRIYTRPLNYNYGYAAWPAADPVVLAAMVPRHLPLFIELAVQQDLLLAPAIYKALAAAAPEDRRDEIIRRIPDSRTLALIARDRGWLDRARPEILTTLLRDAGVPIYWEEFLRNYRLPDITVRLAPSGSPRPSGLTRSEVMEVLPFKADLSGIHADEWLEDGSPPELPGDELARRLVPVLEKARAEHEPAWHLALQYSEFLYHGETAALEALLRHLREDLPDKGGWRAELVRQWSRQPDRTAPPAAPDPFRSFINSATAGGFQFDRPQRLWIRQPAPPVP